MKRPSSFWQAWTANRARPRQRASEAPLRAELFSVDELARHARALAANHQTVTARGSNALLARLDRNEQGIRTFNRATMAVDSSRRITPAAEWLLDNFYLIEEQIQMARRHLPRGYSRELPRLLNGPSAGLPRVYDIVLELISHVDAQVDQGPLSAFVAAYQTVDCLKLGELWAIPIMLRLGLIENLQRITTRLAAARQDRNLANLWVNRLQEMAEKNPSHLVIVVADMAKADLPRSSSFVAEFSRRLSRQSSVLHFARSWLDQRLLEEGSSIEQLVQLESQGQAADQVSVSHSIASLRLLSATDWKGFVEGLSLVEGILHSDPAGVYGMMDFATRDRYRHSVEFLARHSRASEGDIARGAIQLAQENALRAGRALRSNICRTLSLRSAEAPEEYRAEHLGRRMVPSRLLRQRRSPRVAVQSGMPDRLAAAKLVGDQRRGRPVPLAPGNAIGGPTPGPKEPRPDRAVQPALRQVRDESRIRQGLHSRRARERRPIHAWRDMDCDRLCADGRRRARLGVIRNAQSRPSRRHGVADRRVQG
jgi:hypothetical protein